MSLIGVSNEPLQGAGLYGYDGTLWRPVKVDSNGVLSFLPASGATTIVTQATAANLKALVDINTGQTIAVTQATAANLKALVDINTDQNVQARGYGYAASSWLKNPVAFGYQTALAAIASNTSLSAGTNILTAFTVPASTAYIVTNVAVRYDGTVTNVVLSVYATISSTAARLYVIRPPVTTQFYDRQGWWVFGPGDTLTLNVANATANDDAYIEAGGFQISLA